MRKRDGFFYQRRHRKSKHGYSVTESLTESSVPDDADCLFIDSPSTDISEDEKMPL